MRAEEFLKELEYLLQDIPEEEKRDAIAYYQDYLEEAGAEQEEEALREFGSPERVAAIIRTDLAGDLEEGGSFTDSGYKDERFQDPRYQVARKLELPERAEPEPGREGGEGAGGRGSGSSRWERFFGRRGGMAGQGKEEWSRRRRAFLLIVLVLLAMPFLLGLGKTMSGITAGIFALAFLAVILVGVLTVAACIGAVCALVSGFGLLFVNQWGGVLLIGGGILLLGLGLLGIVLSILLYGILIPKCIGRAVDCLGRMLHSGRRTKA